MWDLQNSFSIKLLLLAGSGLIFFSCSDSVKIKSGSDLAISGKESFADSAVSTVRLLKDDKGREVLQKNNTYYDLVDFIDRQDTKKIMLKITKSETSFIDSNTADSHFMVSATNIADGKAGWKKEFSGSDIDYTNKVIIAHTEGRNSNEEDTYTQYSLLTGEKLMTYTYGQLTTLIPNTSQKRFFGYLSGQSATQDRPQGFALVSYVGSDAVIDKVNIKLRGNNTTIPVYTPELKMLVAKESGNTIAGEGKTVILGHADRTFTAKDINNFALQINYFLPNASDPITILLPVREDRLDIENATYDKGIFELSKIY
jgi:hypothetical protein